MKLVEKLLPAGYRFRELWLPEVINGVNLPSSVVGGRPVTLLNGAALRTTADGVKGNGAATSNINCGAIHDAAAKFATRFRFMLTQAYAAGDGDQYLCGKYLGVDDYIRLYLSTADGLLHLKHRSGGADLFDITVGDGTFNAVQWYDVYWAIGQTTVGGAVSDGARLRLDNGVAATDADVTALPNGGDLVFLDFDDPGAGTGLKGIITDIFTYTDDVTAAEEASNFYGVPNNDAVNIYTLDEGRGVTAYDRGTGGNNGTLDTSCVWAFGQVKHPVLGPNGVNEYGRAQVVDISGNLSVVFVAKMKTLYASIIKIPLSLRIDVTNFMQLTSTGGAFRLQVNIGGDLTQKIPPKQYVIDEYAIIIFTLSTDDGGTVLVRFNETWSTTSTGIGLLPAAAATMELCSLTAGGSYEMVKPLLVGIVEGALSRDEANQLGLNLNNYFRTGLSL